MGAATDGSGVDVTIMIVTRNRPELLREALRHVTRQRGIALEVVVVDDHSDYDCETVIAPFRSDLQIKAVRLPAQSGTCVARNRGIMESSAEVIVQLDDDSWLVEPDAARVLADCVASDATIGALAVRLHYPWSGAPNGVGTPFERWQGAHLSEEYSFQGCSVVLRRSAAIAAGMYPASYIYYGEEDYLAARLLQAGYRIRLFSERTVVHGYDTLPNDSIPAAVQRRKSILNSSHLTATFLSIMPFPLNLATAGMRLLLAVARERLPLAPMLQRIREARAGLPGEPMTWRQAIAYFRLRRAVWRRLR